MLSSSARTSMKSTPQTKNGLAAHLVVFQDLAILAKPDVEAKAFSPMRRYGVFLHGSVYGLGCPQKTKKPRLVEEAWRVGEPGGDLLSHGNPHYHRRRRRFTVLFGMGRGGSNALWPPGNSGFALRGRFACDPRGAMHSEEVRGIGGVKDCSRPMTLMFGVIGSSRTGN